MNVHLTAAAFQNQKATLGVLFAIMVVAVLLLLLATPWIIWFLRELKYLNSEIGRTEGREREHWKRRKRRLLLSIIPFVKYK